MSKPAVGFMSYVRFDDAHENGRLTEFCKRLSGEVRVQTGEEFRIFQDRSDIHWGQQWKQVIEESLDSVGFLVPILTPGFFRSPPCRGELERFLEREKQLERNDLVLPVFYVNCPVLTDKEKREADPLAQVIASRQFADWRELRFEPLTSPQVGKMLAGMATQIVEAMERGAAVRPAPRVFRAAAASVSGGSGSAEPANAPVPKTEPPTLVVDALHRGDYTTLTAALKAAKPGDRILVRPGIYREGIVIDKPVEIVGDGELGDVVIEATGDYTIRFQANMGRVANITLRQAGGGDFFCVDIGQGRLELEGCDVTSKSLACVGIHDGADPRLRRNRIHDGKQGGVYFYESGQGTLEDNEIFGNAKSGVEIKSGSNPTLRHNRIYDGKGAGVFVWENSQGILDDNEIFGNAFCGVEIRSGGNPTLCRNRIHDGKVGGVFIWENGQGIFEVNEIFGNAFTGVEIKKGGNPTLRRNQITNNAHQAIWIYEGGQGTFEENDLRGNQKGAWYIAPECLPNVKRVGNKE